MKTTAKATWKTVQEYCFIKNGFSVGPGIASSEDLPKETWFWTGRYRETVFVTELGMYLRKRQVNRKYYGLAKAKPAKTAKMTV